MRNTKTFTVVLVVIVMSVLIARTQAQYPRDTSRYPQATGIFPQVVACVPEHPPPRHTGPNWQPTLKVTVEPGRDPGRVREYRVLGCSLYYYHAHFK